MMDKSTMLSTEVKDNVFPYLDMGSAFIIGLSMGYALKKSFKILLFLFGLGLIFVFMLESQGAVVIDEDNMQGIVSSGMENFMYFLTFLKDRLENYKSLGALSAVAGFYVGLKIG